MRLILIFFFFFFERGVDFKFERNDEKCIFVLIYVSLFSMKMDSACLM
jgi:hypothetical protein